MEKFFSKWTLYLSIYSSKWFNWINFCNIKHTTLVHGPWMFLLLLQLLLLLLLSMKKSMLAIIMMMMMMMDVEFDKITFVCLFFWNILKSKWNRFLTNRKKRKLCCPLSMLDQFYFEWYLVNIPRCLTTTTTTTTTTEYENDI